MKSIELERAQNHLIFIWTAGGICIFLAALAWTFAPNLAHPNKVWEWTIPSIFPTLSLILGAKAGTAVAHRSGPDKEVGLFFFRVAAAVSVFYLLIVLTTFMVMVHWSQNTVDLLATSSVYLAPLQGLTSACLGAFFVSGNRPQTHGSTQTPASPSLISDG